jgi:hypothetical protein
VTPPRASPAPARATQVAAGADGAADHQEEEAEAVAVQRAMLEQFRARMRSANTPRAAVAAAAEPDDTPQPAPIAASTEPLRTPPRSAARSTPTTPVPAPSAVEAPAPAGVAGVATGGRRGNPSGADLPTPLRLGRRPGPNATAQNSNIARNIGGAAGAAAPGGGGEWEMADFSYEALLELGSMAVPTGLDKRQLQRYKPHSYAPPAGGAGDAAECTICLDDVAPGAMVLQLQCKHVFHGACILPWLAQTNRCPTCRFEIPRL